MMKKHAFTLHASDAGGASVEIPLSFELVASLVSQMPDVPDNSAFFEIASQHPSARVRQEVAEKDNLSDATVARLLGDVVDVLRSLVNRSGALRRIATTEDLVALIDKDVEIARLIASNIEAFEDADLAKVGAKLMQVADPAVAGALADNYGTPKNLLKSLLKHADPYVVDAAKRRLEG